MEDMLSGRAGKVDQGMPQFRLEQPVISPRISPSNCRLSNQFTIIGDACHASLPFQAQGASLAVEDGAVLGRLLGLLASHTSSSSLTPSSASLTSTVSDPGLPSLLELYAALRKPRVRLHNAGTEQNGMYYHFQDGPEQRRRDEMLHSVDWSVGRELGSCEWTLMDGKYQREMLGFDVIEEAERMFKGWLARDINGREKGHPKVGHSE
ncbi:MAG: hypothetical protein Q9160_007664 [Pyrenula sp. 1 TL-2023]